MLVSWKPSGDPEPLQQENLAPAGSILSIRLYLESQPHRKKGEIISTMCYSDYIDSGGTDEDLVASLDEFFLGGESSIRRVMCEDNEERNQILYALLERSSLLLGFSIAQYESMEWNSIYYDRSAKEIHSGLYLGFEGDKADIISMNSIYLSILGDVNAELVELPDIMALFEPAC